jgi:hypothetical protein
MKYIAIILLGLWGSYMIYTQPHLTPSENWFLWILSVLSIMYTVINTVVLIIEGRQSSS